MRIKQRFQHQRELSRVALRQYLGPDPAAVQDSMTLEGLFARKATYGHSHGNLQTRQEAIRGISHNQSAYRDTWVSHAAMARVTERVGLWMTVTNLVTRHLAVTAGAVLSAVPA